MSSLPFVSSRALGACLLVVGVGAGLAPALAVAADAAGIPEIIVTTQRREENLQAVPVAVSAFDAQALENRQVADYQDLQSVVPSLKMTTNITSPTNLSPSLRGSLQQDASLIVAESPFGIYVDDIYVGRLNGNNIALNDVERVEVLRGPQGTLYGRNTLAGALKFVTRTPSQDSSWFDASAGFGNYNQYMLGASAGGAFNDAWAGSIAGLYNFKEGEFENVLTGDETDEQKNYAVRGKLRYTGIDKLDVVFAGSYVESKNDSLQMIPATTPGVDSFSQFTSDDLVPTYGYYKVATPTFSNPAPPPITGLPQAETKQTIASLNVAYDFDAFTLRSITGYVKTKDFFSTDFSGEGNAVGASDVDVDQWSEELQIQGSAFNDRLDYLGGLYYLNEQGDQDFGWFYVAPVSTTQSHAETDSYAVFGQVDYHITDALKVTAGLRWVRDEKTFRIDQQVTAVAQAVFPEFLFLCNNAAPPPTAVPCSPGFTNADLFSHVARDDNYTETTPRLGIDYTVEPFGEVDNLMLYASAAKGFKSGGYNGIAIFNLGDAQSAYGPEKNWTYEAGFKMDAMDRRVRLNMAYFYADISDLTANATVGLSFPVANVGDATVHGIELELTMAPTENLTVFWNAAFEHGEYGNLNETAAPAQALAKWGVHPRVPQVPSYAYTLGFDYGRPVDLGSMPGKFHLGMDWFNTDDYITSATNDFVASAYDRLNGYVGLDVGSNWNVTLSVKNLADSEDITSGSRAANGVGGPSGFGGFIIMPPREVMLQVNYKM